MRGRSSVPRRPVRRARQSCPLHAEVLEGRQLLATFTVINTADAGVGSLRQAIFDANANLGPDQIAFNIGAGGSQVIALTSALPQVSDRVVIDGTTQPGFDLANPAPLIVLDGSAAGPVAEGLVITASGGAVRGLVINQFGGAGIHLTAGTTAIEGNYIGTDLTGTIRRGNGQSGIFIENGSLNTIGGVTAAQRNVISGNDDHGIRISGSPNSAAQANLIVGNYIGIMASGMQALGNLDSGIDISGGAQNSIGGSVDGSGNSIAANSGSGIRIGGGALSTVVQRNRIGEDAMGRVLGNLLAGVEDLGGIGTLIGGGLGPDDPGNRFSFNGGGGINISGTATAVVVQRNQIVGNVGFGVRIAADNNTIGGPAGTGNNIRGTQPDPFNRAPGVTVANGRVGNTILSNSIGSNGSGTVDNGLGIDLNDDGVVQGNDPLDTDAGANNGQNSPVINQVGSAAGSTQISGNLNSTPNATFTLQFFADSLDPSGSGEGGLFLGTSVVTTDGNGNATFRVVFPGATTGLFISATATSAGGDTSEFSAGVVAGAVSATDLSVTIDAIPNQGTVNQNLTYSLTVFNNSPIDATNVILTDTLSSSVIFLSATGGVTPVNGTLTFNLGTIPAGTTSTVLITVQLTTVGSIVNQARVESDQIDATPADNTASLTTQIVAPDGTIVVQFLSPTFNVVEGDGDAIITVTRSSGVGTTSVNFATSNGTALAGADYVATTGTLTFNPGETSKSFTIPIGNDFAIEPNETVNLTLSAPTGGAVLTSPGPAVLTIGDNDPTPEGSGSFRFSNPTYFVDENASVFQMIVVERVGGKQGVATVDFFATDGTAQPFLDYIPRAFTITFSDNDGAPKFLFLEVRNNGANLGNRSVNLRLLNPGGGATLAGPSEALLTITDVIPPPASPQTVMFNAAAYAVDERAGTATITVTRSGSDGQVRVGFATSDGTALAGINYTTTTGTLTFNPGETLRTFTIPILNTSTQEGNRSLNVTLSSPSTNARIAIPSTVSLTVVDDETPQPPAIPSVAFIGAESFVNEADGTATLIVTRPDFTSTATVDFATLGGTAAAGIRYVPTAGTLVFNPNETAKAFTIQILNTTRFEGTQTVLVGLSNPSASTSLGTPSTTVLSIFDDELAPPPPVLPGTIAFGGATFTVTENGGVATITLVRTGGSDGTVSVDFSTAGGTATPGTKYIATAASIVFAAGQTTATVDIPILDNSIIDGDQTVGLLLANPTGGATLGSQAAATLTILDNELDVTAPTVTDLQLVGNARMITAVVLSFSEALDAARASNPANYSFVSLGRDGILGTRDDQAVGVQSVTIDPATGNVTVVPARPLAARLFTQLLVNATAPAGLTDARGNLLNGDADGTAGGNYAVTFARSPRLQYTDRDGDAVSFNLARGGTLDLVRAADGEGLDLRLINPVRGRSVLSGSVRRRRRGGDGRTTLQTLTGLDPLSGIPARSRLRTPPFFIGRIVPAGVDALLAQDGTRVGRRPLRP